MMDETMPDTHRVVRISDLTVAKNAAREARAEFDKLSIFEKTVAREQIKVVTRLVEAVERLSA